jgi:hypothetical protein
MLFEKEKVSIKFDSKICYCIDGKEKTETFEDGIRNENLDIKRAISENNREMRISVKIRNTGDHGIFIRSVSPVHVSRWQDFKIGEGSWEKYQVFRSGRHKNDIPSVFCLGLKDRAFTDAASSAEETGRVVEKKAAEKIVSDSLTVFRNGDQSVSFDYPDISRYFVNSEISFSGGKRISSTVETMVMLEPGETLKSDELHIRAGMNPMDLIDRFSEEKMRGIKGRGHRPAPLVYCTWYYYGLKVTGQDVKNNLRQIKEKHIPYEVFQIDEGWETVLGEWKPNRKFPRSMKTVADKIRLQGLIPGIWTSPFIAHESASVWKKHSDWKLRNQAGDPCLFPMNGIVYQVLDITNPEVLEYVKKLYRKLTYEWGYAYHKLDFTRAAVLYEDAEYHDKTVGAQEAYRNAMKAVREGIGDDSYLLLCGGLYDAAVGIVDAQRTGSDVLSMWNSDMDKGGKTVPFTIKQNVLRFYMNKWWSNDPDALMLRRQKKKTKGLYLTYGLLNDEEVKTVTANQYMTGGLLSSTEPLDRIDEDRLWELRHIYPNLRIEMQPADLFSGERFLKDVQIRGTEQDFHELIRFNWDDSDTENDKLPVSSELFGMNISRRKKYLVCEFFSRAYRIASGYEVLQFNPVKAHGCAIYKIQEYHRNKVYIVASTAHYSIGEETDSVSIRNNHLDFEMHCLFPVSSEYTILLPSGYRTEDGENEIRLKIDMQTKHRIRIPLLPPKSNL